MTDKLREAAQQAVPQHLADDERVAALCDLSYVAGMKAGWNFCISDDSDGFERRQNSVGEAIRLLKSHRAPTPAQQDAQAVVQPSPTAGMNIAQRILHVGGRNNAAGYVEFGSIQAVEALVRQVIRDLPELVELENLRHNVKVYREATALTLNAAPTPPAQKPLGWLDRKAVECLQGSELNWMPAWNRPTSSDPVPIFLLPPAQRVMLTDEEIEQASVKGDGTHSGFARAVIEAYERKNGIK